MSTNYSTLEVAPQHMQSSIPPNPAQPLPDKIPAAASAPPPQWSEASKTQDQGKEVAPSTAPQVAYDDGRYKHSVSTAGGGEAALPYNASSYGTPATPTAAFASPTSEGASYEEKGLPAPPTNLWRRRRWWIVGAIVLMCVILAAVLGGVLGSRHSSSNTNNSSSSTSNSTSTKQRLGVTAISLAPNNDRQRLYTIGKTGEILDGLFNNEQWSFTGLNIFASQDNSAIAVAITDPEFNQTIHMVYIDKDNVLQSANWRNTTLSWTTGNLGVQRYIAGQNTNLAMVVDSCVFGCSNKPLLAYQDRDGNINIANFSAATNGSDATYSEINLGVNAMMGTSLSLQSTAINGSADTINLYYQKADGTLTQASWNRTAWNLESHTFRQIAPGASISATAVRRVNGSDSYVHLLSLVPQGIAVDTFEASSQTWWPVDYPAPMSNQTGTSIMYEQVNIDSWGSAYVVSVNNDGASGSQIMAWQAKTHGQNVTWTYNSTIPIPSNEWGF